MNEARLTILIPCYNQPGILERCLLSINNQIFKNYRIILVDDASTISYEGVIKKFSFLPISIIKHKSNLGAVPNMIFCLKYKVDTPYKIVFHEDDLMYPQLLEKEIAVLESNDSIAWVATNMSFFKELPESLKISNTEIAQIYRHELKELIGYIIKGKSLSFASVMYRSSVCKEIFFDLNSYSVLGDRPMLIELARKYGCAYINSDLVAAYNHHESDSRWLALRKHHIYNLYSFFSQFFDRKKEKEIKVGFTRGIIESYKLISSEYRIAKLSFYFKAYRQNMLSLKYLLLANQKIRRFCDFVLQRG